MFYSSDSWGKALQFALADASAEKPAHVLLVAPSMYNAERRLDAAIEFLGIDRGAVRQHMHRLFRTDQFTLHAMSSFKNNETRGMRVTHVLVEDVDFVGGLESAIAGADMRGVVFIREHGRAPDAMEQKLGQKLARDGLVLVTPLAGALVPEHVFRPPFGRAKMDASFAPQADALLATLNAGRGRGHANE